MGNSLSINSIYSHRFSILSYPGNYICNGEGRSTNCYRGTHLSSCSSVSLVEIKLLKGRVNSLHSMYCETNWNWSLTYCLRAKSSQWRFQFSYQHSFKFTKRFNGLALHFFFFYLWQIHRIINFHEDSCHHFSFSFLHEERTIFLSFLHIIK